MWFPTHHPVAPPRSETSASDQAASAHERQACEDASSHPLLCRLRPKELARLRGGATAMRALIRMKVADDMDLAAAGQALHTAAAFFTGVHARAAATGMGVYAIIQTL